VSGAWVTDSRRLTLASAAAVVVLAALALLLPHGNEQPHAMPLLVFDPTGELWHLDQVHRPLAEFITSASGRPVVVRVFTEASPLLAAAAQGEALALVPDGLALCLQPGDYAPVAAVRRAAPRNLRPRGVLVHRRDEKLPTAPWKTHAGRTVVGDSLCLSAVGAWALDAKAEMPEQKLACGPDPFDHSPALHALRLGGYDYALVRQWDAERFLTAGLLDPEIWDTTAVTPPVPDLVLLASRSLTAAFRLSLVEKLRRLGREADAAPAGTTALLAGLDRLGLAGFNPLVEPDMDQLRRRRRSDWPRGGG